MMFNAALTFKVTCQDPQEKKHSAFNQAMAKLSAKQTPSKASALGDDAQLTKSSKRKSATSSSPSGSKKKAKSVKVVPKAPLPPVHDLTMALDDLNSKIFPTSASFLPEEDFPGAINSLQSDLLQVLNLFF